MNIELKSIESKKVRLTVTPNRLTLKFPITLNNDEKEKFKEISLNIVKEISPITKAWRGSFYNGIITLYNNSKNEKKNI